jgi:hypothetical protein
MKKLRTLVLATVVLSAAAGLAGCQKKIEAPDELGVCYHMVFLAGNKYRFNEVARNKQNLEQCAASLEGVRERFLGLGSDQEDIIGAYQGNFLFLGRAGVFTSTSLTGVRYPALVRTGDGRLAIPSAIPQQ